MALKKSFSLNGDDKSLGLAFRLAAQIEKKEQENLEELYEHLDLTIDELKEKIEEDCEEVAEDGKRKLDIAYRAEDFSAETEAEIAIENFSEQIVSEISKWCAGEGFKNVHVKCDGSIYITIEW